MSGLVPFLFENEALVRVVMRSGEPWFVLADVCRVLDIKNPTQAADQHLDDDERAVVKRGAETGNGMTLSDKEGHNGMTLSDKEGGRRGGAQSFNVVSESGLYALAFSSRKPQAKRFRKWVTGDVIPAIRKTGSYQAPGAPETVAALLPPRAAPVLGRSAATCVNLDLAESCLDNRQLRVLAALRGHENQDGFIRCNMSEIIRTAGLSYQTVDRAMMFFLFIGLLNNVPGQGWCLVPKDNTPFTVRRRDPGQSVVIAPRQP